MQLSLLTSTLSSIRSAAAAATRVTFQGRGALIPPLTLVSATSVSMPRSAAAAVLPPLLLLCALLGLTLVDSRLDPQRQKRASMAAVAEDDFTLTPEQERLLFQDDFTSLPLFSSLAPSSEEAAAAAEGADRAVTVAPIELTHTLSTSAQLDSTGAAFPSSPSASTPVPTFTPASPSSSARPVSSSAPASECVEEFGGVVRLLSALFSPSAIHHPGRWSIHTSVTPPEYASVTRSLRQRAAEDTLDLLALGERLLASASYHDTTDTYDTRHRSEGSLTTALMWLQRWVAGLEAVVYHKLVAPLHLPSTAASVLHSVVVLLLPLAIIAALYVAVPVLLSTASARTKQHRSARIPTQAAHNSSPAVGAEAASRSSLSSPSSAAASTALTQSSVAAVRTGRHPLGSRLAQTSTSDSFASALWIGLLLLLLTLFTAGYVHHYHTLHIEQVARNRILQSNPPAGCYQTSEPVSLASLLTHLNTYLTRAKLDDACWRYEASLLQSSWPNPLLVLSSYLSTVLLHPLTHLGDAMGGFTSAFLSHHSIVMQGVVLAFLLLFSLGVVALCMAGGKACVLRWCTAGRRTSGRGGMRTGRAASRSGRRWREDGVRTEELIEREEDDELEEEEDRERRQLVRRLLHNHKRREEEKQRRQLLMLVSSQPERGQAGYERQEEDGITDEHKADAEDSSKRVRAREHCPARSAEVQYDGGGSTTQSEADNNSRLQQQYRQPLQQQQQQTVKKEEREWLKEDAVGPSSSSSSSSVVSVSSSTSTPPYLYPVARPSSERQAVRGEAAVKDEEALCWSGNPLNSR